MMATLPSAHVDCDTNCLAARRRLNYGIGAPPLHCDAFPANWKGVARETLAATARNRSTRWGNNKMASETPRPLDLLEQTILVRQRAASEKSYTAQLLSGGVEKIGGKIIEESAEFVEAASEPGEEGRAHTIGEAGDLLYHLLVLLTARGIRLAEVEAELAKRFGVSGIEEKATRSNKARGSRTEESEGKS